MKPRSDSTSPLETQTTRSLVVCDETALTILVAQGWEYRPGALYTGRLFRRLYRVEIAGDDLETTGAGSEIVNRV